MSSNFQRTADWLQACGKEPLNAQHLSVQIGVDLEESAELWACIEATGQAGRLLDSAYAQIRAAANLIKLGQCEAYITDPLECLDALCDREVTGNGIAYLAGFDKDGADQEVLGSNDSKLVDGKPVILPGGKIGKGANYRAPELEKFI